MGEGIDQEGRVVAEYKPQDAQQQERPERIANRQAEIMLRIGSEFGFTPASRSRISAPSAPAPTLFDYADYSNSDDEI